MLYYILNNPKEGYKYQTSVQCLRQNTLASQCFREFLLSPELKRLYSS
jgi:hypothetical protein